MRTLLKVSLDVEASNKAIKDGSLPKIIQSMKETLKPEAAYFLPMDGLRTAIFIFDMKDPSEIPFIAEPFFMGMNAKIDFYPVMNFEDLQKGLKAIDVIGQ